MWARVHTDEGVTGLGETFFGTQSAEAHIHQTIAPYLIAQDPRNIERHQAHLTGYVGFIGSGAETRGRSAIDLALWDLFAKSVNLPLCDALGGRVRDSIRVYNTCAGYSYVQTRSSQGTSNFGLDAKARPVRGPCRLHEERRRGSAQPARDGHRRDEDLAVRLRGGAQQRPVHINRRSEEGA
jgi:L-alanine-DL-glutamate epimerase-like enolase superfamily enzyme